MLHSFSNSTDGVSPSVGLIYDAAGNLYSTTGWVSPVLAMGLRAEDVQHSLRPVPPMGVNSNTVPAL